MKLVCAQNYLSAKLSLLSRVVPSNPAHPVLANVLLTAETGRLSLTVFDLSLGIQVWLPAQVEVAGSITLPARLLNDIVSRLPNSAIEIRLEGLTATLACASGHYQMQGIAAEEFPSLPEIENVEPLVLPAAALLEGLQGSLFAASADETKQVLTGLHLRTHLDYIEFAATDGHRLAVTTSSHAGDLEGIDVTIPAKALRELERMLGRSTIDLEESALALQFDPGQVIVELATQQGPDRLSCRLIEGQYPNYHQLIPQQFAWQVTVERQLLLGALERIAVLAAQKNNIVKIKVDPASQHMALSAEAPQFGSGEESLPAQISTNSRGDASNPLEIAFNVKYLMEGLKAMLSSEVQLQFNTEVTPAVLSPLSGRKMTYLIMPIQIRSS